MEPDEEKQPTPEELAAQEEAQKQAQMALEEFAANMRLKNANAAKIEAQAGQIASKTVGDNVDAQTKSLNAARAALAAPAAIPVADHILHESGFNSRSSNESAATAGLLDQQQQAEDEGKLQQVEQDLVGQSSENLTGAAGYER